MGPFLGWIDRRLPVVSLIRREYGAFPMPRNLNGWWNFGALATITLLIMLATGLFMAIHYTPDASLAFDSVQRMVRDVPYGWLLRGAHAAGASLFFALTYLHLLRGLYYGSYKAPRELLWLLGVVLYLLMMVAGFTGYVLPWSQLGFWGATVITNLFGAVPWIGDSLTMLVQGGFSIGNATLHRFYVLHWLTGFLIVGVLVLHVAALHVSGSNNPLGVEPRSRRETLPFHPYFTAKEAVALCLFLLVYAALVFFLPQVLEHADAAIPANPLVTPAHIVPEWYFLPFYAMLRAVPDKLGGALVMAGAVLVWLALPWLDGSPVRSMRFRPLARPFLVLLVLDFALLMWAGAQQPEGAWLLIARLATTYYFAYFLVLMPLLGALEKPRPLPAGILPEADPVLTVDPVPTADPVAKPTSALEAGR